MPTNDDLLKEAEDAMEKLFSDMTVSKRKALENMNALVEKAQGFADVLECDIFKEIFSKENGDDE